MKKKILIVKPKILDKETKTELKKAGYIIIETENPKDIQVFDELGTLDNECYLGMAMEALSYGNDSQCRQAFGKLVREDLLRRLNENKHQPQQK